MPVKQKTVNFYSLWVLCHEPLANMDDANMQSIMGMDNAVRFSSVGEWCKLLCSCCKVEADLSHESELKGRTPNNFSSANRFGKQTGRHTFVHSCNETGQSLTRTVSHIVCHLLYSSSASDRCRNSERGF